MTNEDEFLAALLGPGENSYDPRTKDQKSKNRSRNYIRYKVSRNHVIDGVTNHPMLTEEEKFILSQYNDCLQALVNLKVRFFLDFYDNCPKAGSTLKRKKQPESTTDLPW